VCGTNCCLVGQACENGRCVAMPDPGACVAFGQACKNVGVPCCDGLVCGSGQGGAGDVACHVPAGGACATTSECVFGSQCLMGLCVANPQPEPTPIVQCTPTVDISGNGLDRGNRLRQAFIDAANGGPSTIYLGSGTYDLGELGSGIAWNHEGKTVTLQTCPDVDATVVGPGSGSSFSVSGGTVSLVGPGLSIIGSVGVSVGLAGTARLRDVNVTGQALAIQLVSAGTVEISGGSVVGLTNNPQAFYWHDQGAPATLTCTSNPSITGACVCGSGSKCADNPPNGTCCQTWT